MSGWHRAVDCFKHHFPRKNKTLYVYYESIKSLQNGRCQLCKNFNKYVWNFLGGWQENWLFNLLQFTAFVWWPLPAQMTYCFHTGLGDASSQGRDCLGKFSPFNTHCVQGSHSQKAQSVPLGLGTCMEEGDSLGSNPGLATCWTTLGELFKSLRPCLPPSIKAFT